MDNIKEYTAEINAFKKVAKTAGLLGLQGAKITDEVLGSIGNLVKG